MGLGSVSLNRSLATPVIVVLVARGPVTSTSVQSCVSGSPVPAHPASGVAQAAIAHLDRWARGGPPPPRSPRLATDPGDQMRLVTDDAGIARGGIRTGWVDVPVAALSGLTPPGATGIGILLGSTREFDAAELARRYPAGPGEYAAAFREATARAAAAGFLLEQDVEEMVAVAAAAYPGRPDRP